MAFTNYTPPLLNREQSGALPDLIGNLLSGYGGSVSAKYAPQQQEADIFNKQLSPLATLSVSPMFLQNPQFQSALGGLIAKNLSRFGGKDFKDIKFNMPTYAQDVNREVHEAGNLAGDLSKAGKARTSLSGGAGWLENNFGEVGKKIADYFTHGTINSNLANQENRYKNIMEHLKNTEIQSQRLSRDQADEIFTKKENETYKQHYNRIKESYPNLFQQGENQGEQGEPEQPANAGNSEMLLIGPDGSQGFVPADKAIKLIESGKFREAT